MLPQQMLFLWRNHGCQLLQIAYHQELHTTERQIVALAILAKHRIYSIEQIAAHHTDSSITSRSMLRMILRLSLLN